MQKLGKNVIVGRVRLVTIPHRIIRLLRKAFQAPYSAGVGRGSSSAINEKVTPAPYFDNMLNVFTHSARGMFRWRVLSLRIWDAYACVVGRLYGAYTVVSCVECFHVRIIYVFRFHTVMVLVLVNLCHSNDGKTNMESAMVPIHHKGQSTVYFLRSAGS